MKNFFSRFGDSQASSSKPTKESAYKFWIPSNTNAERGPSKPIPDVVVSHGEKRSRALKSTHAPRIPLHDVPTPPIETQVIHTNDMSRHTTRPNPGSSSTPYPTPPSRTPRPHEYSDTKHQIPPREAHGPHPTGTHTFREMPGKGHRVGRHEPVAPVHREIWLQSTTPTVSKQVEDQTKLHVRGTNEKMERHRESGDVRDRVKELERREKDRDRDRREREREKERELEKGRAREREREERERERSRAKEREVGRAKREQDRNWEVDQGRDRDKHAERDRREKERDSDREGEKGKNRTKDKGSRKENSNSTRGMERTLNSDVLHDGERPKQDERGKVRHRDRATVDGGKDDNHESNKERDRWLEKEPERAGERPGGQIKHRAEATDGEQDSRRVRTPAPDRERRKDSSMGWVSDIHTGHSRRPLQKASNTQPPGPEDGESSDSSTRPKRAQQVLTKRHRAEEGGSSSKVLQSCTLFLLSINTQNRSFMGCLLSPSRPPSHQP